MNPLEAILQALNLSTRVKTWEQLIAFLTMLALIAWLFTLVFEERNKRLVVDRDIENQIQIIQSRLEVESIIILETNPNKNRLDVIWEKKPQIKLDPLESCDRIDLFRQLREGDCYLDTTIAKDANGVFLPALFCPITRKGETVGAVAGVDYELPPKDSRGEFDPHAEELYRLGTLF